MFPIPHGTLGWSNPWFPRWTWLPVGLAYVLTRLTSWRSRSVISLAGGRFTPFLSSLQRQRLRQLILRQQQQKNVSRQEKVLQDGAAGPPHHWLQKESTSVSPANPFGRPPPPYPGSVRPSGTMALRCPGNFTAEQPRNPSEAPLLRQNPPGEQGVPGLVQR